MQEFFGSNSSSALKLCIHDSHHSNISVAVTVQNSFIEGKHSRTQSRQFEYRCYFYDRLNRQMLRNIASQFNPSNPSLLNDAFDWIRKNIPDEGLKYVLVDGCNLSEGPEELCIRTRIFPAHNELAPIYFLPKN